MYAKLRRSRLLRDSSAVSRDRRVRFLSSSVVWRSREVLISSTSLRADRLFASPSRRCRMLARAAREKTSSQATANVARALGDGLEIPAAALEAGHEEQDLREQEPRDRALLPGGGEGGPRR